MVCRYVPNFLLRTSGIKEVHIVRENHEFVAVCKSLCEGGRRIWVLKDSVGGSPLTRTSATDTLKQLAEWFFGQLFEIWLIA